MVREERVTATGWRLVGDAVSLADQGAALAPLPAGNDESVLYAARFQARPRLGRGSAVFGILAALGAAVARDWQDAPPLTREHDLTRPHGRFHGLRWQTAGESGAWRGELRWRHPHPVIPGSPCTTHVVIDEQQRHTLLTLRVSADAGIASVRGAVGAGQARPAFLAELSRTVRLSAHGGESEPRILGDADINDFVREELLSETRDYPVALLAPLEAGDYALSTAELAEELLGLAPLYVIDRHPATFRLSDALGDRRLSCYWGALRVYMPGFSCADRPEDHPLLMRERLLDPVDRAGLTGRLGLLAGRRIRMPGEAESTSAQPSSPEQATAAPNAADASETPGQSGTPAPLAPATARVSDVATTLSPDLAAMLSPVPPLLSALSTQIGALAATITHLVESNAALSDEIARLRTTTAVRAGNTAALERRVGGLEHLLRQQFAPEAGEQAQASAPEESAPGGEMREDDAESLSLLDVLRQAATSHSDALLVLDAAERSATDSPFEDVDRVAVILDAMAALARRRQEGALGTPLRVAFRELGIDYRGAISSSTSERHLQQYQVSGGDGRLYECREHIVLGSSYDPRHCLRIYFTSRAAVEPRFVIGHVGRHFDVATTS